MRRFGWCRSSHSSSTSKPFGKLAERGLSKEDALSLFRAAQVVWTTNPNPRAEHSLYVIGPTPDGRMITVVVDRDTDDHGRWHVMTASDATPAQIALYRKAR